MRTRNIVVDSLATVASHFVDRDIDWVVCRSRYVGAALALVPQNLLVKIYSLVNKNKNRKRRKSTVITSMNS